MTEPNLEQEITNIFITIDNYGTAEEARVDIRKLIANQVKEARIDELEHLFDRADGERSARRYTAILEQRIKVLRTRLNGVKNRSKE